MEDILDSLGRKPYFCVIGEACKINQIYTEDVPTNGTPHLIVKPVGLDSDRPGQAFLVRELLNVLDSMGPLVTLQNQFETLFFHKKTKRVLFHIKPDRQFGFVNDYLDIRIAKHPPLGSHFTWESYTRYFSTDPKPNYVFYDADEIDFPENNLARLISDAPGPIYASTRKRNLKLFEGVTALVVSEKDFKNSTSVASNLIVTLGEHGAMYEDKVYPVEEKAISGDNYGCREAFLATFTFAHTISKDIDYSITMANKVASYFAKFYGYPKFFDTVTFIKTISKEIYKQRK